MKKSLFGTSALVAAGALMSSPTGAQEERIKLGLAGYMDNYFAFGDTDSDNDVPDRNHTGLFSDGEIWFLGETTLDNGVTFGANVQLESFGASGRGGDGDIIDEDYAYVSGNFGKFIAGSENSAAYLMHFSSPFVGVPINTGWVTTFIPFDGAATGAGAFRTPRLSTYLDWDNDENIVTYFTPRYLGFQFGASYAPTVSGSGDGANFPIQADQETEFSNGVSIGLNFDESFGGFKVSVSGGWRWVDAPDTPGAATNLAGNSNNLRQYSTGASFRYEGFTVGGGYAKEVSGRATEGDSWDAGVSYQTGDWTFGVQYFGSEVDGSGVPGTSGDDDVLAVQGGAAYEVGPGITASANVLYADYDGSNGIDSDGILGVLGLTYNF